MVLAFQNGNAKVTRGRQFAKWTKRPFSGKFGKSKKGPFSPEFNLENGRVVATETFDLYPRRLFD